MIAIRVDFNDLDGEGRVVALRRLAPNVRLGERVYLLDDEGNRCWGKVREQGGRILHIEADWDTWSSRPDESRSYAAAAAGAPRQGRVLPDHTFALAT